MKFDKLVEVIYSEEDIGRGIATSFAGIAGLLTYVHFQDWVIAAFASLRPLVGERNTMAPFMERAVPRRLAGGYHD